METLYLPALDENEKQATLIWLHGMGVDGSDFESFQEELDRFGDVRHLRLVLPTAPVRTITCMGLDMPAWYDVKDNDFNALGEDDIDGMNQSREIIQKIIAEERAKSPDTPIWLGGFSQGAAMALLVVYSQVEPLAGIIALSGYVPKHPRFDELSDIARQTPVFMAHGTLDTVISIAKARNGLETLNLAGASVEFHEYPMMHELCPDEMADLGDFIRAHTLNMEQEQQAQESSSQE